MKSFIKKINNKIRISICFKTINPHRHWKGMLITFLVLITMVIIFDLYVLYRINNDEMYKIAPREDNYRASINESLLKKVNEQFDQKLIKEKELRNIKE